MANNDRYSIAILDVTLDVIEKMAHSEEEFHTPASLARKLNINRSRLFRILKTLEQRGYVDQDPATGNYRLGLNFLSLSQHIQEHLSIRREAGSLLSELADGSGDCVHFLILSGDTAVVVDRYIGENSLQATQPIGKPIPLHTGAAPKLLLAFMPAGERENVLKRISLDRFTDHTITEIDQLRTELDQIRNSGVSIDHEEFEPGVFAYGVPVFDFTGNVIASISIAIPVSRNQPERCEIIIQMLTSTARELSFRLGYRRTNLNTLET